MENLIQLVGGRKLNIYQLADAKKEFEQIKAQRDELLELANQVCKEWDSEVQFHFPISVYLKAKSLIKKHSHD